jgi:hypothetical protein
MPRKSQGSFFNHMLVSHLMTMPEGSDIDKNIYKVEKHVSDKDIFAGIQSHAESERDEERKGGPASVDRSAKGPYVRACLYPCEDEKLDRERRHPPR